MDDKPSINNSIAFDRHNNTTYFNSQSRTSIQTSTSIAHLNRTSTMESSNYKMAVGNLVSPPEAPLYESFDQKITSPTMAHNKPTYAPNPGFLSPPTSPENLHIRLEQAQQTNGRVDPILYPQSDASSTSQLPLFMEAASGALGEDIVAQVDQHISSNRARRKLLYQQKMAPSPEKEHYLLVLDFKSRMMHSVQNDPTKWASRERQYLQDQARARNAASKKTSTIAITPKKAYPVLAPSPSGVQKVRSPPKPTLRTPKARRERTTTTPDIGSGRSRNTGTSTREDKDFMALQDRSPPLGSIDDFKKKDPERKDPLNDRVEWKCARLDISNDQNAHLLHADERVLASHLRLDCATYLTSKRRIFLARYECFKGTWGAAKGKKEFRKTDAQQACKIDVNKASKLWTAFDSVGWFDESWVRNHAD